MKKTLAACCLVLALSACADDPLPPLASAPREVPQKIGMNVRVITLTDRSKAQQPDASNIASTFKPTISDAIKRWASGRLQATGAAGQAVITIKEASLVEKPLPIEDGMSGWFTRQQASEYIGRATVSIEASNQNGFANTDASASRKLTLPEDPSDIEEQDAYMSLLDGLMEDLSQNLDKGIYSHMSAFVGAASTEPTQPMPQANSGVMPAAVMQQPQAIPPMPMPPMPMQQQMVPVAPPMPQASVAPPAMPIMQHQAPQTAPVAQLAAPQMAPMAIAAPTPTQAAAPHSMQLPIGLTAPQAQQAVPTTVYAAQPVAPAQHAQPKPATQEQQSNEATMAPTAIIPLSGYSSR